MEPSEEGVSRVLMCAAGVTLRESKCQIDT